jgi:hypothetical protein
MRDPLPPTLVPENVHKVYRITEDMFVNLKSKLRAKAIK